jgi:hypothetical protein
VTAEALHICPVARQKVKEYLHNKIENAETREVVRMTMMAGESPNKESMQEYLQMKKRICNLVR